MREVCLTPLRSSCPVSAAWGVEQVTSHSAHCSYPQMLTLAGQPMLSALKAGRGETMSPLHPVVLGMGFDQPITRPIAARALYAKVLEMVIHWDMSRARHQTRNEHRERARRHRPRLTVGRESAAHTGLRGSPT